MKFIYLFFIIFILFSCNQDKKCIEKDIGFLSDFKITDIVNLCDYESKLLNYIYIDNNFNSTLFFELTNKDKNLGLKILDIFLNKYGIENISEVDKIKLYYILREIYKYDDKFIEKIYNIKIIGNKYDIKLERLISAENLLTQCFLKEECETYKNNDLREGYLTGEELLYLTDIFKIDIGLYDNINLVSDLKGVYDSLKEEDIKLYINMLNIILENSNNEATQKLIGDFLESLTE